jgi:membrane-bound lytic murein transglycosylase B
LCLDDLKPRLDPEIFTKPEKDMVAAFNETMVEHKLWKQAEKRGVDKQILADTAKQINFQRRCTRSVYSIPPKKKKIVVNSREAVAYQ